MEGVPFSLKSLIFVIMTVENYIRDLLYRYECVIIPEFGALITQRKPAEIHRTTQAFYPPKKVISFNRQLTKSDGLLANYIADSEKISFEASMQKIQQFVKEIKTELTQEKGVSFDRIGVFTLEKDDKLLFQPSFQENYLLDSFGMSSFSTVEINREVYKKEAEALEEKTGLVFTHEKKKTRTHAYMKYAAVGLLALGLSGFLGINWYSGQVEAHNIVSQEAAENQFENKIQRATFVIGTPLPEITFGVDVQPGKYHVVAGAFREKANAVQKTKELIEKGFHARQIGENKYGLHQVIYGSYQSRRDAINALYKVQRTDNENAWLLVQEL